MLKAGNSVIHPLALGHNASYIPRKRCLDSGCYYPWEPVSVTTSDDRRVVGVVISVDSNLGTMTVGLGGSVYEKLSSDDVQLKISKLLGAFYIADVSLGQYRIPPNQDGSNLFTYKKGEIGIKAGNSCFRPLSIGDKADYIPRKSGLGTEYFYMWEPVSVRTTDGRIVVGLVKSFHGHSDSAMLTIALADGVEEKLSASDVTNKVSKLIGSFYVTPESFAKWTAKQCAPDDFPAFLKSESVTPSKNTSEIVYGSRIDGANSKDPSPPLLVESHPSIAAGDTTIQPVCLGEGASHLFRRKGLGPGCYYAGEPVVVIRSDGRRTVAVVLAVAAGDSATLTLGLGDGMEKVLPAHEVPDKLSKLIGAYYIPVPSLRCQAAAFPQQNGAAAAMSDSAANGRASGEGSVQAGGLRYRPLAPGCDAAGFPAVRGLGSDYFYRGEPVAIDGPDGRPTVAVVAAIGPANDGGGSVTLRLGGGAEAVVAAGDVAGAVRKLVGCCYAARNAPAAPARALSAPAAAAETRMDRIDEERSDQCESPLASPARRSPVALGQTGAASRTDEQHHELVLLLERMAGDDGQDVARSSASVPGPGAPMPGSDPGPRVVQPPPDIEIAKELSTLLLRVCLPEYKQAADREGRAAIYGAAAAEAAAAAGPFQDLAGFGKALALALAPNLTRASAGESFGKVSSGGAGGDVGRSGAAAGVAGLLKGSVQRLLIPGLRLRGRQASGTPESWAAQLLDAGDEHARQLCRLAATPLTVWHAASAFATSEGGKSWRAVRAAARFLREHGLDCPWMRGDERGVCGETPLHVALLFNRPEPKVKEMFFELWDLCPLLRCCQCTGRLYRGENVLHLAIIRGFGLDAVQRMLVTDQAMELLDQRAEGDFFKQPALPNGLCNLNLLGEHPLCFAACSHQMEVFRHLVLLGANVRVRTRAERHNLLHLMVLNHACMTRNPTAEAESLLLSMYEDVASCLPEDDRRSLEEGVNQGGLTPVKLAAAKGSAKMFTRLFDERLETAWTFGPLVCKKLYLEDVDVPFRDPTLVAQNTAPPVPPSARNRRRRSSILAGDEVLRSDESLLEVLVRMQRKDILAVSQIDKLVEVKWTKYGGKIFHLKLGVSIFLTCIVCLLPMAKFSSSSTWKTAHTVLHLASAMVAEYICIPSEESASVLHRLVFGVDIEDSPLHEAAWREVRAWIYCSLTVVKKLVLTPVTVQALLEKLRNCFESGDQEQALLVFAPPALRVLLLLFICHAWVLPLTGWSAFNGAGCNAPPLAASAVLVHWLADSLRLLETCLYALMGVFSFLNVLSMLMVFEKCGAFVLMLTRIITKDLPVFVIVYAVLLLAFAHAHFLASNELYAGINEGADSMWRTFRVMVGEFHQRSEGDSESATKDIRTFAIVTAISIANYFIVSVVLLNLLIAMLSSTYAGTYEEATQSWKLNRAEMLVRIDKQLTEAERRALPKKFWQETPGTEKKRFITFNIVEDHNVSSVGARTSLANSAGAYNLLRAAGESVGLDLSSAHGATDVLIALLDNEVQCNPSFHRRIITDSP